jgi:hypothetical protein
MIDPNDPFGVDLSCATGLTPTMLEISGLPMMAQVCCRRLSTPNMSLLSAPDERTTDLRLYIGSTQKRGAAGIDTIQSDATAALLADPRIFQVELKFEAPDDMSFIELGINGVGSVGPFQLTLKITADKVEVLNAGS